MSSFRRRVSTRGRGWGRRRESEGVRGGFEGVCALLLSLFEVGFLELCETRTGTRLADQSRREEQAAGRGGTRVERTEGSGECRGGRRGRIGRGERRDAGRGRVEEEVVGRRRRSSAATVVVVLWATLGFSSTPTSRRLPPAATAVFLLYDSSIHPWGRWNPLKLILLQAQEQHRAYLKSLPATSYPLEPTGDAAEVNEAQRVTEGSFEQR